MWTWEECKRDRSMDIMGIELHIAQAIAREQAGAFVMHGMRRLGEMAWHWDGTTGLVFLRLLVLGGEG